MTSTRLAPPGVLDAAAAWARAERFATLADVPPSRANELVGAVMAQTGAPRARVVEELLQSWRDTLDYGRDPGPPRSIPSLHPGMPSSQAVPGTLKPVAGLIDAKLHAKGKASIFEQLADKDRMLRQTLEDLERCRFALTGEVRGRTLDELHHAGMTLLARLAELEKRPDDEQVKEEIVAAYQGLLSRASRDRGVFLVKDDAPAAALQGGPALNPAPTAAASTGTQRQLEPAQPRLSPVELRARAARQRPLLPEENPELGKPATLVLDPLTGQPGVIDVHGDVQAVLTLRELVTKRQAQIEAQLEALAPRGTVAVAAEELRAVNDKELDRLGKRVTYVSLKQGETDPVARVFATKWYRPKGSLVPRRVIARGPFRGVFLDDLVNRAGRAGGRGYALPAGPGPRVEVVTGAGEAFATTGVVKQRGRMVEQLFVSIPYTAEWTAARRAIRNLSVLDPNVVYLPGTKNTSFYFPPECAEIVRDVLGGLKLDGRALEIIDAHHAKLRALEAAMAPEELENFSAKAIGGFKKSVTQDDGTERPFGFNLEQMQGLARLAFRGYRDVDPLKAGRGKTLLGIAAMMDLKRRQGEKRPFLIVTPPLLRGNFTAQMYKFLERKEAEGLAAQTRVLSYKEFTAAVQSGELDGKPFNAKRFGAVIFDEATWVNKLRWPRTRAALAFGHPRTICLTASPIEKTPVDTYVLSCIAEGVNLQHRQGGRDHRWRMRKFTEMVCEMLGGQVLGIKDKIELMPGLVIDPKKAYFSWLRTHLFYPSADADEGLPKSTHFTQAMVMSAEMEKRYRRATRGAVRALRGAVSRFRDKGVMGTTVDRFGREKKVVNPLARDKRSKQLAGFSMQKYIAALNAIGNNQAKIDAAREIIGSELAKDGSSRAVLFSDSAPYVVASAKRLSEQIPIKLHAACLAGEIKIFQDGKEVASYGPNAYQGKDRRYEPHEWQQYVMDEVLKPDREVATATMYGPSYQHGQNLQWANLGIHLDRDTWNSENMMQRKKRIVRQGQERETQFYNLDWVFRNAKDDFDRSLDEIRRYAEELGAAIVDAVNEGPKDVRLGKEWAPARDERALRLDRRLLAMGVAPTVIHVGSEGSES